MVRRDLSRKKKPRIVLPRRHFRSAGELHDEPEVPDEMLSGSDIRLMKALSYYNYVDLKDRQAVTRKWVLDYMAESGWDPEDIQDVGKMEDWRIYGTISSVSRMIQRGFKFEPEILAGHEKRLVDIITGYRKSRAPMSPPAPGPRPDKFRDSVSYLVGEIESMIDSGEDFSTYEFLTSQSASTPQAKAVSDFFKPRLEEYLLAKDGTEPQLKEAYKKLGRAGINKMVERVRSIVDDADRYASNKRASVSRKPKKPKEKSAALQVKSTRYLSSYPDLQLVSVDPITIVGAGSVWLYNVKYKEIKRLTGSSLSVSGSTIHGFDPSLSEARKLRHPSEVLKLVLDSPTPALKTALADVKTKCLVPNGRINSDTIILRVTK